MEINPNLDAEGRNLSPKDREFEQVLRPKVFDEFRGQPKMIENLKVFIQAAKAKR